MAKQIRNRRPNILLVAVDSLRRDRMSCYGYHRLTTPHIDRFAEEATVYEETISAHIPTTSAYASMLTGRDCFGTEVVALRHRGGLTKKVKTLPEILRKEGFNTSCIGFTGNPSSRGFSRYLEYDAWGSWEKRPLTKAQNLNDLFHPELKRLNRSSKPWFMMLRHMDPHAPYMPPPPFDRMFYQGNECDRKNKPMKPVKDFKPFRDFHLSWLPPGITDRHFVDAQYDGEIAYMDSCIAAIFDDLESHGILEDTIVILNGDHGETLYEHECWYDHHGLYEPTLVVPLMIRYPPKLPTGVTINGLNQHKDLVPTILELAGIKTDLKFDGGSLVRLVEGRSASFESEIYITECTWMRKHGWRTPEWKLIVALEPDFHFKPPVELYNLIQDPLELDNRARKEPGIVEHLNSRMDVHIRRREKETGTRNPIFEQPHWHGYKDAKPYFESSDEAYNTFYIGDASTAKRLQARGGKD